MAASNLAFIVFAVLTITAAAARKEPSMAIRSSLEARLRMTSFQLDSEDGGGMVDCWGALYELRSCTNEVVLFFLNGESYIGHDCCRAIRIITHQCWPNMLSSIGFTAEEGDVLRDYCDVEATGPPAPVSLPPTPAPGH
ncbi:egg cell-secreted protein 1.2-like [Wolffia australiana]